MQSFKIAFERAAVRMILSAGSLLLMSVLSPLHALAQEGGATEIYQRHCSVCHGAEGKGDGPASRAFDPPPPDLSDPTNMGEMTDDELLQVLAAGRQSMPAFQAVLEPEVLGELVEYLRELSAKPCH